eukprot:3352506-Rhodomonas_salina.2
MSMRSSQLLNIVNHCHHHHPSTVIYRDPLPTPPPPHIHRSHLQPLTEPFRSCLTCGPLKRALHIHRHQQSTANTDIHHHHHLQRLSSTSHHREPLPPPPHIQRYTASLAVPHPDDEQFLTQHNEPLLNHHPHRHCKRTSALRNGRRSGFRRLGGQRWRGRGQRKAGVREERN